MPTIDPHHVAEVLCLGKTNISVSGALAVLTLSHMRLKAAPLFDHNISESEEIIAARVVITVESLSAMRDLIDRILPKAVLASSNDALN